MPESSERDNVALCNIANRVLVAFNGKIFCKSDGKNFL